ncbi:MAG: tetratricopeptide repeat protein [Anaerolineae bacterium]|nr:tetratricopeptide repeat protein [Anaerolineae bacterium]MCO5197457.1 tetratricopeptide repeat protein [Anaerolineae bacterium]
MRLKPEKYTQLHTALCKAFNPNSFTSMLKGGLGLELTDVSSNNAPFPTMCGDVIRWAEERDQVEELIAAAYSANDTNRLLQQVRAEFDASWFVEDGQWPADGTPLAIEAMPLDDIPQVAPLPRGSRMPLPHNPQFVGREAELRRLARALQVGDGAAAIGQPAAVTGYGGIGKTQLAVEFVHCYGQYFAGGVYWLNFSSAEVINTEVARCGGMEGMALAEHFDDLELDAQVAQVRRAWREPIPRLLIFDNCDSDDAAQLVQRWRPKSGGCRVLVTSRRARWDKSLGMQTVALHTLMPDESRKLLQKLAPHLNDANADAVANALGHFPLALHLAGSFLDRYDDIAVEDYLRDVAAAPLAHPSMVGHGTKLNPTDHINHVAQTFAVSWERLNADNGVDRLALVMAAHMACVAPGVALPEALLKLTIAERDDAVGYDDPLTWSDARGRLRSLGLLERDDDGVRMHRLIVAFVAQQKTVEQQLEAVETALLAEAWRLNDAGYPQALRAWLPHLEHVTEHAFDRDDIRAGSLCDALATHYRSDGNFAPALPLYERALAIAEEAQGADHPETGTRLNNLANLYQDMGAYERALPLYERALAIAEAAQGADHPTTGTRLNNLALLYQAMGAYERALPLYERALAIAEEAQGADHPETGTRLNNLANLYQAMGAYERALPLYERALAIAEAAQGADHPTTGIRLFNLAALYWEMGERKKALPPAERALAIFASKLGLEHPYTKTVQQGLDVMRSGS